MEYVLEMKNISKTFPGVVALDHVQLQVKPGEVHALMGENGAGKSTLMKILMGIYTKDPGGEILFDGKPYHVSNPKEAMDMGVAMIHQELNPILDMTVYENIFVGREIRKNGLVDKKAEIEEAQKLIKECGLHVSPKETLRNLTVAQCQLIEIINGILAFGMMFVIVAGGFDMSVGSTVAFTGVLAAMLGQGNYPLIVPLAVAMLGGLAVGIANGIGVAVGNLPPFIMTLGTMTAVRGLALVVSGGKPVIGISPQYKAVAASTIGGIPMLALYLAVIIAVCSFVLAKTVYGRRVYACGGNLLAAKVSGINTTLIRISTFAIAGLLAGLSGFLMTSRVTIGQPTAAESYEMDAITACVVGGVSMSGGVGKPWGVVVGCLLITVIANGLDIMGVSSHWQRIVKGAIIVLAVLIDIKGKSKKN